MDAVQARRHNGKISSCFFFSSAKVRSFEMLRPNAIGLTFVLRFSTFRPTGLNELTRIAGCRPMRELFAKFFSSLSDVNDVVKLLAERLRTDAGTRSRLRTVIVSGLPDDFLSKLSPFTCRTHDNSFNVELSLDEMRNGGFGGLGELTGTNVCAAFGNGANKSIGFVTFVIG